jgi:Ca-activated chloride channel family protein
MTFNPEDPKWTAYVLGELENAERAEMDSLLESSEEARAYVEELRVATGALEHELKVELKVGFPPEINAELAASLTDAQRAAIQAAAGAANTANNIRWFRQPQAWLGGLAVAAMILIAIAIPSMWKAQKTVVTADKPVQSASSLKSEESISPSPAVTSDPASKPEGTNEISKSSDSKVPPAEQREAIVIRAQSDESKLTAPQPPQSVQALSGISSTSAGSSAAVKQEAATTVAVVPTNSAGTPPSGGNNIINDVFPPIAAPRGAAGGGGGRGGVGGLFGTVQGGTITGTVTDPSGALIPGVTVTATNTETGVARTTLSTDSGAYNFVGLAPGPYRLSAALTGFQTALLVNINLGAAESQRINIAMTLGNSAGTTVSVALDAQNILSQSSTSIGQVLTAEKIQSLPVIGNNVLDLLSVLPGVQTGQTTINGLQASQGQQGQQGQQAGQGQQGQQLGQQGRQGQQGQQAGQGQGQGQQVQISQGPGAGGGIGTGEGHGVGAGARGGAAAAPPPPPPPPPASPVRIIPDNPTVFGGFNNYDRPAAPNSASYAPITDNPFRRVSQEPLSTFSSDVDTASYANLRRFINQNQLPPAAAVRIEEMVNYFNYDYAQPSAKDPIGASMEIASAPWNPTHRLVRIGIKARDIDTRRRPPSNLVFLIDVSGSMQPPERLPLIKNGLKMLVGSLSENDHVSIVVYAGASGVVLPSTSGNRKDIINAALDRLEAGGSTNGGAGIQLAYQIAMSSFIQGGVNRVILATDGDFNVGVTNQTQLTRLIQDSAKSGVFLSVLGVGTDNLKDSTMERLADTGNGNYAYLDSLNEAYKVLVEQMSGTLVTVAKDVKLQVEFNPAVVEAYRLIGYENRLLANADFNNDRKDAGDMGAGHTVTALYEIVPRGGSVPGPDVDPLKYQTPAQAPAPVSQARNGSTETLTLKIRYKDPDGTESKLLSLPLTDREGTFSKASADFRFAASVAEFGMILRDSPYRGKASVGEVIENAQSSKGSDRNGYRQEFIGLVQRARQLRGRE